MTPTRASPFRALPLAPVFACLASLIATDVRGQPAPRLAAPAPIYL